MDGAAAARVRDAAAVVVTGSERAFSTGADTTELREMTPERIAAYYRGSGSVYEVVAGLPQPAVAAVSGYCLGGGFELALACDFRVADTTATFGLPEVGLGILPSSGGLTRLVRAVGPRRPVSWSSSATVSASRRRPASACCWTWSSPARRSTSPCSAQPGSRPSRRSRSPGPRPPSTLRPSRRRGPRSSSSSSRTPPSTAATTTSRQVGTAAATCLRRGPAVGVNLPA